MKNYLISIIILAAAYLSMPQAAAAQDFSKDTLWSKNFWPENVNAAWFTPNGKYVLAAVGKTFCKFDINTGELISRFKDSCLKPIYKVKPSPNERRIITIDEDQDDIYIWDYQNENIIKKINFQNDKYYSISTVVITNDGKFALIGMWGKENGDLLILNLDTYLVEKTIPVAGNIYDIAVSPDTNSFTISILKYKSITEPFSIIRLLSINDWETNKEIGELPGMIISLNYSPDGRYLACGRPNFPLTIWDMKSLTMIKEYSLLFDKPFPCRYATFSKESKYILFAYLNFSSTPRTYIFDFEKDSLVYQYNVWSTDGLEMSYDDKYVLCAAGNDINVMNTTWLVTSVDNHVQKIDNTLSILYTKDTIHFEINIKNSGLTNISIYDINGNKVQTFPIKYLAPGHYNFTRTTSLPTGVYFAVMQCGDNTISQEFQVVR